MAGFPTDLFHYGGGRYIIIMNHIRETDGTFGYFYSQHEEHKAIDHYNKIKERRAAENSKDSVLYLNSCQIVSNPELKPIVLSNSVLSKTLRLLSNEELEDVIKFSINEMREREVKKWNVPEKVEPFNFLEALSIPVEQEIDPSMTTKSVSTADKSDLENWADLIIKKEEEPVAVALVEEKKSSIF